MFGSIVPISTSRLRTDSISDLRVGSFIPSSALAIVCATVQPYMANASLLFVRGEYFLSAAWYSFTAASSAHCASSGSLK